MNKKQYLAMRKKLMDNIRLQDGGHDGGKSAYRDAW